MKVPERSARNFKSSLSAQPPDDDSRIMTHHSGIISKKNGWVSNITELMNSSNNLKKSIHEGSEPNEENNYPSKLEILSSVGRQEVYTSVLEDVIFQ
jgi:hypothetical protein